MFEKLKINDELVLVYQKLGSGAILKAYSQIWGSSCNLTHRPTSEHLKIIMKIGSGIEVWFRKGSSLFKKNMCRIKFILNVTQHHMLVQL